MQILPLPIDVKSIRNVNVFAKKMEYKEIGKLNECKGQS